MNNLYETFQQQNKGNNKPLLITEQNTYTFKDIDHFSAQFANELRSLGVSVGDRVAVQIEKSAYNIFLYLACLRSGVTFLPLNSSYSLEELKYFFGNASPKLIVCDPKNEIEIGVLNSTDNILIKTLDVSGLGSFTFEASKQSPYHVVEPVDKEATAVMLYTSGTTGKPKGAMITHSGLFNNACDLNTIWGISEADTLLHMLPLFHVHGLFFALNTCLLAKSKIILLPKFDAEVFFKYLPQTTVFMGVPTYYIRLLNDSRLNVASCKNIRVFISGSAPLLPQTFQSFEEKTGHAILERYGMTETGINTSNPLNGKRKIGSVGLALPSISVRVVDNNDQILETNKIGEIQIKGPNLFNGYWNNFDKTQESFTNDGFFKTGDLGVFDVDGYLNIVGRSKDLIITGGLNVYPKEVEETLDGFPGITESAVVGVPHAELGEAVIAVIATQKNLQAEEVILFLKKYHAGYKCPKKIIFVDVLPKNTMGKVQKNILRDRYSHSI